MKQEDTLSIIGNERGIVLVVAMMLIATLMILGTTAVITSTTDMRISSNYKASNEAFYIAEAGAEAAREQIRQAAAGGATLTSLLEAARGTNGTLTNSLDFTRYGTFANFYANGAYVSDDVPYIATTNFGTGTYRVYLTNDTAEGATNATDINRAVTVTSFGFGPQGSMAVVQTTIRQMISPELPGAIVLPGPDVSFAHGPSGPQIIDGGSKPAIAVDADPSLTNVLGDITKNPEKIKCDALGLATPCVQKSTFGPPWGSKADILDLYSSLEAIATCKPPSACTMGTSMSDIVILDGTPTFSGNDHGYGILVVTGTLTLSGNISFDGLILVIGDGSITRDGGGTGTISGSIVVANTSGTGSTLGLPTYNTNGGGTSEIKYDGSKLRDSLNLLPFVKTNWKQSGLD